MLLHKRSSHEKLAEEQVRIFLESQAELLDNENVRKDVPEYAKMIVMVEEMWHCSYLHFSGFTFLPSSAAKFRRNYSIEYINKFYRVDIGWKKDYSYVVKILECAWQERQGSVNIRRAFGGDEDA